MAFTPGSRAELQLKLASIYHTSIYMPVTIEMLDRVCTSLSREAGVSFKKVRSLFRSVHEIEELEEPESIIKICLTPVEEITWNQTGEIKEGLRGAVYRSISNKEGISLRQLNKNLKKPGVGRYGWAKEAAWLAVAATGGANAWQKINLSLNCDIVCFDEASAYAASKYSASNVSKAEPSLVGKIELAIPSAENLSWENVFALRDNPNVHSFRTWVEIDGTEQKTSEILDGLWSAFEYLAPNVRGTIFKGILSNIPLPIPINPASALFAVQDTQRAIKFRREHGAMIFFHDLRKSTLRPRL